HEEDIALRANRIIKLFDGTVDSDTMNKKAEEVKSD
ncbi:MAG: macrolide ABC transporter ATP-binding protein, partial [Bacteroidetes bacterium]|nr:macrolide ABC transporter ATP-binding protein [Bacteroidota bacterium]